MIDHPFERNANPRSPRSCSRCGKVPEAHPAAPVVEEDPARDLDWEVSFAREACRQVGYIPEDLIALSQQRTDPGPVRQFLTRDLAWDLIEEIADGINYATWEADRARRTGVDLEAMQRAARVVGHLALAYAELTRER